MILFGVLMIGGMVALVIVVLYTQSKDMDRIIARDNLIESLKDENNRLRYTLSIRLKEIENLKAVNKYMIESQVIDTVNLDG